MSTLTALARAQAVASGVAQPIATVRHVHLAEEPMVLVPLTMAGEANAPLAALVGTVRQRPQLLIVPQPRNRDQRFAFAAELASVLVPYIDSRAGASEAVAADRGRDTRWRSCDAPQILVPNSTGVGFVRLFGRSTRFRRTEGEYAVAPAVPLLGRWLTFLAERAEYPGSSVLLAVTDTLSLHWATGQSAMEDANLAAQLAWIDPPGGRAGADAAREAEDPAVWPPAGPATDPDFDNRVLAGAMAAYSEALAALVDTNTTAGDVVTETRAYEALERVLRGQLQPTWDLMWRAVDLLRALPEGARVANRWAEDRDAFTETAAHIADGGPPQPRRDGAVTAARRLHRLERALASYTAQRAYDDPLVLAEYRLTGEAFAGTVTVADRLRIDSSGRRRVLRPLITVVTDDPVRVDPGTQLSSPARPGQQARVVEVTPAGEGGKTEVLLELSGGMGRALTPAPGSVPEAGEEVCYAALGDSYAPPGVFPSREETPWTHGGPPVAYTPDSAGDAPDVGPNEEWS